MRHHPGFPQHDALRVRFDRRDLALYWGYVQGLDPRELHGRYFTGEPIADLRHVRARVRAVAEDLAAAARRTDRPALGGLFLRDPRAIAAGETKAPSLDDLTKRVDPHGDFYSQAELQTLWLEEYGAAAGPEGSAKDSEARGARASERRARLLQRIREGLAWIESQIFPVPEPGHRIEAWLPLVYAKRLKAAGITTIGELTACINRGGSLWYRHMRGVGQAKAGDIERWLERHAQPGVFELQATARMTRTELAQFALTKAPESPVLPLERLRPPAELDGAVGRFRAAPGLCTLSASNDLEAVKEWIKAKASPHTQRAYRREAERLLLWCLLMRTKPMSSLTVADCEAYRAFVRDPQPAAQWCGPRGMPRWSRAWRPFEGPLSSAAERHALIVLKSMGAWFKSQNYLVANPWDALGLVAASRAALDKRRAFTTAQWQLVREALDELDDSGARPRLRFALLLLYGTGLRLSEAVAARVEDLHQTVLSDGAVSVTLKVVGKGGKERSVPIAGVVFDELQRYLATRGWPTVADAPARAFLLARAAGGAVKMPNGLQYDPFGALAAGTLYSQVKAFFTALAKQCAATDAEAADRLRKASTHWLRHTFGTRIATMTRDVVLARDLLGHASVATTSIYLDGDEMARRDAVERLMEEGATAPRRQAPTHDAMEQSARHQQAPTRHSNVIPFDRFARRAQAPAGVKVATIRLHLRVENNNKFVRGKKRAREDIELYALSEYDMRRLPSGEYELQVPYNDDEDLDRTMRDLLSECDHQADMRHCFTEADAQMEGSDRYW